MHGDTCTMVEEGHAHGHAHGHGHGRSGDGRKKTRVFLRAALVHGFSAAMLVVFILQANECINKYNSKKIVEDVSSEHRLTGQLPPMTLCTLPSVRFEGRQDPFAIDDINELCNGTIDHGGNYTACVEAAHFARDDIVYDYFPLSHSSYPTDAWKPSPEYLLFGRCFHLYTEAKITSSIATANLVVFNFTTMVDQRMSVIVFFHNPHQFVPSLGISDRFLSQKYLIYSPTPNFVKSVRLSVSHRVNMGTRENPCNADAGYTIYNCTEAYIRRRVGCASPWDLCDDGKMRVCSTNSDFDSRLRLEKNISRMGESEFYYMTGCAPPCEFDEFQIKEDDILAEKLGIQGIVDNLPFEVMGLLVSLQTTYKQVIVQNYFYDVYSLVGEIGGSMGMLLGASLISVFELIITGGERAAENIARLL